jgi:5'-methylthioadenosine phosphorylase
MVLEGMKKNVETYRRIVKEAVAMLPKKRVCPCSNAMQYAIITDPKYIPAKVKRDLKIILGKYLK